MTRAANPRSHNGAKAALDLQALLPELSLISNRSLRRKVGEVWQRCWRESAFERIEDVPVSRTISRPQPDHNRSVINAVVKLAEVYEESYGRRVDRDVLVAAALLHDVSKLVEYAPGETELVQTEIGRWLPHPLYGVHVALEMDIPLDVVHAILVHSPESATPPRTLEGWILRCADQLDVAALGGSRWKQKIVHYR